MIKVENVPTSNPGLNAMYGTSCTEIDRLLTDVRSLKVDYIGQPNCIVALDWIVTRARWLHSVDDPASCDAKTS